MNNYIEENDLNTFSGEKNDIVQKYTTSANTLDDNNQIKNISENNTIDSTNLNDIDKYKPETPFEERNHLVENMRTDDFIERKDISNCMDCDTKNENINKSIILDSNENNDVNFIQPNPTLFHNVNNENKINNKPSDIYTQNNNLEQFQKNNSISGNSSISINRFNSSLDPVKNRSRLTELNRKTSKNLTIPKTINTSVIENQLANKLPSTIINQQRNNQTHQINKYQSTQNANINTYICS